MQAQHPAAAEPADNNPAANAVVVTSASPHIIKI